MVTIKKEKNVKSEKIKKYHLVNLEIIRRRMEIMMLNEGIKGRVDKEVKKEALASSMGSGLLPVFATPAMVTLMEETAWRSVEPYMEEGCGTVGTALDIKHLAATPEAMKVWCESELIKVDGRRLVFDVKVYDECGIIGEGTHERFIINNEKFAAKAAAKKQK